jgi:hypothetical protein
MVCEDVVATVIVPEPEFFMKYILPLISTAVGRVTVKVPLVHSIALSLDVML